MAKILTFPINTSDHAVFSEQIESAHTAEMPLANGLNLDLFVCELELILADFERQRDDLVYQKIEGLLSDIVYSQAELTRLLDLVGLLKNVMDLEREN